MGLCIQWRMTSHKPALNSKPELVIFPWVASSIIILQKVSFTWRKELQARGEGGKNLLRGLQKHGYVHLLWSSFVIPLGDKNINIIYEQL